MMAITYESNAYCFLIHDESVGVNMTQAEYQLSFNQDHNDALCILGHYSSLSWAYLH